MKKVNRIIKSLFAMVLALAIAFTFTPATAQAATKLKLRTNAQLGGSYNVETVLPGNVKVKAKVTVTDMVAVVSADGYTVTGVDFHVEYPKSELKKIKKNTTKILQASPVKSSYFFSKTVYAPVDLIPCCISKNTGKVITTNDSLFYYRGVCGINNEQTETFKQGKNKMEWIKSYDFHVILANQKAVNGDVLIGFTGSTKPTSVNNKTYQKFIKGKKAINKTNFYNKKKKGYSIWVVG